MRKPSEGTLRLILERGNEEETHVQCPRCSGRGEIEHRTESNANYSIRWETCWLCTGSCFVTPSVSAGFRAWAKRVRE